MATFSGTSAKTNQNIGSLATIVNGTIRLSFPGKPIPPADRVGWIYVYSYNTSSPFQSYMVDNRLIYIPGLAVNYGTQYFGTGFGMRVDVNWNRAGVNWLLVIT